MWEEGVMLEWPDPQTTDELPVPCTHSIFPGCSGGLLMDDSARTRRRSALLRSGGQLLLDNSCRSKHQCAIWRNYLGVDTKTKGSIDLGPKKVDG